MQWLKTKKSKEETNRPEMTDSVQRLKDDKVGLRMRQRVIYTEKTKLKGHTLETKQTKKKKDFYKV